MPEGLSPIQRTRKNEALILQSMASVGQIELARLMGVSESTVSRLKDGQIATFAHALAHLGLKIIPAGHACFDPSYVDALKTLAEVGIRQSAPKLDWEQES